MNKDYKRLTIRNDDGTWGVNYLELANEVAKWQEQHATQCLSTDLTNILGEKLAELEDKLENGTLIELPKYKLNQKVYVLPLNNSIGTIDGYDLYKHKYLVYIECGDEFGKLGFGNEWFTEQELSATKTKLKQS